MYGHKYRMHFSWIENILYDILLNDVRIMHRHVRTQAQCNFLFFSFISLPLLPVTTTALGAAFRTCGVRCCYFVMSSDDKNMIYNFNYRP